MNTRKRINTKLDEFQEQSPPLVSSWIKLSRSIARRAGEFVTTAVSGVSKSASAAGRVADDGARTVLGRVTGQASSAREASLNEMTKEELYEEAQSLDIDGRSQMSKEELISAIISENSTSLLAR